MKRKAVLPTKKDDLLAMLPDEQRELALESKHKVDDIKNTLYLYTTADQVSQRIVFEWKDNIVEYCEELLRKSILKANWLKSIELNDVL